MGPTPRAVPPRAHVWPGWHAAPLRPVRVWAAAEPLQLLLQQLQVGVDVAQLQGDCLSDPAVAGGSGGGQGKAEAVSVWGSWLSSKGPGGCWDPEGACGKAACSRCSPGPTAGRQLPGSPPLPSGLWARTSWDGSGRCSPIKVLGTGPNPQLLADLLVYPGPVALQPALLSLCQGVRALQRGGGSCQPHGAPTDWLFRLRGFSWRSGRERSPGVEPGQSHREGWAGQPLEDPAHTGLSPKPSQMPASANCHMSGGFPAQPPLTQPLVPTCSCTTGSRYAAYGLDPWLKCSSRSVETAGASTAPARRAQEPRALCSAGTHAGPPRAKQALSHGAAPRVPVAHISWQGAKP